MYTIEQITDIDSVWDESGPLIQSAIDHSVGEMALQDVYKLLIEGNNRLLVIRKDGEMKASVVLDVIDYPQRMAIRYVYLGGNNMRDWIPALDQYVSDMARQLNIKWLEIVGRGGWVKMLDNYGYKPEYVHLIKQL